MGIYAVTTTVATNTIAAGVAEACCTATLEGVGAQMFGSITNDATGPTVELSVQPQISQNGTDWFNYGAFATGSDGNAAQVTFSDIRLQVGVKYARFYCYGNTDEDVFFYGAVQDYVLGSGSGGVQ